jgi:hypothetical protein
VCATRAANGAPGTRTRTRRRRRRRAVRRSQRLCLGHCRSIGQCPS